MESNKNNETKADYPLINMVDEKTCRDFKNYIQR